MYSAWKTWYSGISGKRRTVLSMFFEMVSSVAVIDHLVGTNFRFFFKPSRPAERILIIEETGVLALWSSRIAGEDFRSVSETR